jgi:hypothetical protein
LDDLLGGGPVVRDQEGQVQSFLGSDGGAFLDRDACINTSITFSIEDQVLHGALNHRHSLETILDVNILLDHLLGLHTKKSTIVQLNSNIKNYPSTYPHTPQS